MLIILLILFFKNRKKFIIPFVFVVLTSEAATFFGKILFQRPRPLYAVFPETDFSFPSGHATIAVAFYGYLVYILVRSLNEKYNWLIMAISPLIILFIGFSRLYLGVHYVSDVLAGYLVGSLTLAIGIIWTDKLILKK